MTTAESLIDERPCLIKRCGLNADTLAGLIANPDHPDECVHQANVACIPGSSQSTWAYCVISGGISRPPSSGRRRDLDNLGVADHA